MRQSDSITKLLESLVKAQAEFPTLPKDKDGYNYKYSDLDTVISTLRPILAKHNIGFVQTLTTLESGKWAITTRLFNNAGEWLEDTSPLPDVSLAKGNAAQNIGAAITYMKRYTLCAFLGVSSDEDPDGKPEGNPDINARKTQTENKAQPQTPAPKLKGGPDTPAQHKEIQKILGMKHKDGSAVFSEEDFKRVGVTRQQYTAEETIKILKDEAAARQAEHNAPKQHEPFPEDIPYEEAPKVTPEEEAGADAAFDFF